MHARRVAVLGGGITALRALGRSQYFEMNWTYKLHAFLIAVRDFTPIWPELFLPVSETFSKLPSSIPVQLGKISGM